MPEHLTAQLDSWLDRTLTDGSGHKIGRIADIYTDDDTGQPEWLAVTTGHFGSNVSFVPLAGAVPAGKDIQVSFPKDQVKEAPNAGLDGRLSQEEEARLYAHYGLDYDEERVRLQRWVESDRAASSTGPAPQGADPYGREPAVDGDGLRPTDHLDRAATDHRVDVDDDAGLPPVRPRGADEDVASVRQAEVYPETERVQVAGETRRR